MCFFLGTETFKVAGKYYCGHCKKAVSKSTFYEHRALYGSKELEENSSDCAFHIPANSVELEWSTSSGCDECPKEEDNLNGDLGLEEEDLAFFSEAGDSDGDSNDDPAQITTST